MSAFVPAFSYVVDITNAANAVATFASAHDFSNGEYISFRVLPNYGMFEINNKRGLVLDHDTLTVTTDIDSRTWTPFVYPGASVEPGIQNTPPVAVPAGSGIVPTSNPSTVNLEDAFDNVRT